MNRNKKILNVTMAAGMAAVLGTTPVIAAAQEADNGVSKEETVYVNATAEGEVKDPYGKGIDEYVTVKMENLPELIQSAIKTLAGDTFDIQLLEYNQTKEYTRVTLINKTDKTTKVFILDKEGKEVVEGETQEKEEGK